VTELLKELHRIVNAAIRPRARRGPGRGLKALDLSQIDLEKLRDEFAEGEAQGDRAAGHPPTRREEACRRCSPAIRSGWTTTSASSGDRRRLQPREGPRHHRGDRLDEEQKRATREGLAEDELALFDLLLKDGLDRSARERVKQASRELLAAVKARLAELDRFWEKEQTKADVEVFILDEIFAGLPTPPFTPADKKRAAASVYAHVWQQAVNGSFAQAA
jgi:type I restriction enzyme R subunit